jgi:acylphosphatase
MQVREAVRFTGRVQGVGFRATARDFAVSLALTGWVQNEPDGSVSMQVQGPPTAIEALLARLHAHFARFPPTAHRTAIAPEAETSFSIRS